MSHPTSRAERRHQRDRVIARRKFVSKSIWRMNEKWLQDFEWGRYSKFNMNCGCTMCHGAKYFKLAHKRRKGRQDSESQSECRRADKVGD